MVEPIKPGPGQVSVWDFPRPPIVNPSGKLLQVTFNDKQIAATSEAMAVLEASHPPNYYFPPDAVLLVHLEKTSHTTVCEFKGTAVYYDLRVGDRVSERAAWSYPDPHPAFQAIKGYIAFYPGRVDRALVNGEEARPQEGGFYGGWITSDVVGPFKGGPGTAGW